MTLSAVAFPVTKCAIKDGWLLTGNMGEIINNRFLKIIESEKELIKTTGVIYVAPQPIQNKIAEGQFIELLMVIGAGKKLISALVVTALIKILIR